MPEIHTPDLTKEKSSEDSYNFEFKSSIDNIDQAVEMCLLDIKHLFSDLVIDEMEVYKIDYALRELLVNAVSYGNLQFKKDPNKPLTAGQRQLAIEILEKEHPERAALPVKVSLARKGNVLVIRVIDQGKGFEKSEIPDPTKESHLFNQTGRGVKNSEEFLVENK